MRTTEKHIGNRGKSLIHVAKTQLSMTDDDYRALLRRVAGVASSRDLNEAGLSAVMAEFKRLGFVATTKPSRKPNDFVLQFLAELPGFKTNIFVLLKILDNEDKMSFDGLKSELLGLEESGLVAVDETGPVMVVELTQQGREFVEGRSKSKSTGMGGTGPNSPTAAQWRLLEDRARQVGYSGLADPRFIAWMKPRGKVDHPRFLDRDGARRVIAALGNWINRNFGKTQKGESK